MTIDISKNNINNCKKKLRKALLFNKARNLKKYIKI